MRPELYMPYMPCHRYQTATSQHHNAATACNPPRGEATLNPPERLLRLRQALLRRLQVPLAPGRALPRRLHRLPEAPHLKPRLLLLQLLHLQAKAIQLV